MDMTVIRHWLNNFIHCSFKLQVFEFKILTIVFIHRKRVHI